MGVEPTTTAWEAVVLPINYIRVSIFIYYSGCIGKMQVFFAANSSTKCAQRILQPK